MLGKTITIYQDRVSNLIVAATYVNNKPCPITVDLFGTHILPTPFGDVVSALEALEELNPDATIIALGNADGDIV